MIPIQYFQAIAGAIPTLLIALAVGLKTGDELAEGIEETALRRRLKFYIPVLSAGTIIICGEAWALIALATGWGGAAQAVFCAASLLMCLLFLLYAFVRPSIRKLKKAHAKHRTEFVAVSASTVLIIISVWLWFVYAVL